MTTWFPALNTFCSLTVQRCHNHKFDPITQEQYYAMQAIFAAVDRADRPSRYRTRCSEAAGASSIRSSTMSLPSKQSLKPTSSRSVVGHCLTLKLPSLSSKRVARPSTPRSTDITAEWLRKPTWKSGSKSNSPRRSQ
ncbi:MAG: DUF1549 domain-containing protein [Pirellulaceae bacterium]